MNRFNQENDFSELTTILPNIKVETLDDLTNMDVQELSEAVTSLHNNRHSFNMGGYSGNLLFTELNAHFRGSILIPDIVLIAGRYDEVIAGAIQLFTFPNSRSFSFIGEIRYHFVAPWARGYGLTSYLLEEAQNQAKLRDISYLKTAIRADSHEVIELYENFGYSRWGTLESYEILPNQIIVPGHFYQKKL